MNKSDSTVSIPKSMRHKRILDLVAEEPDASLETIADEIPSVTADLVENVLEEYGVPANDDQPPTPPPDTDSQDEKEFPAPESLLPFNGKPYRQFVSILRRPSRNSATSLRLRLRRSATASTPSPTSTGATAPASPPLSSTTQTDDPPMSSYQGNKIQRRY